MTLPSDKVVTPKITINYGHLKYLPSDDLEGYFASIIYKHVRSLIIKNHSGGSIKYKFAEIIKKAGSGRLRDFINLYNLHNSTPINETSAKVYLKQLTEEGLIVRIERGIYSWLGI